MKHIPEEIASNLRILEDVLTGHLLNDKIVKIALRNIHRSIDDLREIATNTVIVPGAQPDPKVVPLSKPAKSHTPWPKQGGDAA